MDIVDKIGQQLLDRNLGGVTAQISGYEIQEGGKVARVVASFSKPSFTRSEAEAAIADALKGEATVIANTFKTMEGSGAFPVMCGFVSANARTEQLTDARKSKMTVMAKNILMDTKDETLWNVSEDGQFISRHGHEDLSELLASVHVDRPTVHALLKTNAPVQPREFVGFVDTDEGSLKFGMVLSHSKEGNPNVYCYGDEQLYEIGSECVVSAVRPNERHPVMSGMKEVVTAAGIEQFGPDQTKAILDYYKKVYSQSPEYFAHLEELVRKMGTI